MNCWPKPRTDRPIWTGSFGPARTAPWRKGPAMRRLAMRAWGMCVRGFSRRRCCSRRPSRSVAARRKSRAKNVPAARRASLARPRWRCAARVTLRPPWRPDRKLPEVCVNVVLVREIDPPVDDVPVEWVLLTSLPIDDAEQVRQVIQGYGSRWMIEILFRTLKSGCAIEDRRFEHVDRFLPCLAVYLIVTWRTLYVCRLGRAFPDISCEAIFEPAEWKAVCQVVRRQPPPPKPPRLSEMVAMVAQLGGDVNRKRPDPPGPQTVWLGLQRVHDMALCRQLFGPEANTEPIHV